MNAALQVLMEALGPDVVTPPDALGERPLADWSGVPAGRPAGLLRPRDTAQVSKALAICHAHGQPVAVQGGMTGLAGAASVGEGEVALSLERMRAIVDVDPVSATMTVEAGAVLQAVQERAVEAGYYFPLDLGARGSCTIGGMMGTNAGGNRVIKYGMMRDQVLGVEAVMADGRIVGGLHKMLKNNTGYDLRNLLIGAEGTLGVVTRAVLRLRPRPKAVSTAWCGLADFEAVTTLLRRGQAELACGVSAFEVMWPSYYDFVLQTVPGLRRPLDGAHGFHVLLETDGAHAEAQGVQFQAFLGEMLEAGVVEDAAIAQSERDAGAFWAIRDAPGEFIQHLTGLIAFDISFAVRDVAEAARRLSARVKAAYPGALALIYGHLGDGNIHLLVDAPGVTDAERLEVETLVYDVVSELQGSVSAEHGIGAKKKTVLGRTRTPAELAVMWEIKQALDPHGVLNPGRIVG
jgi:FAD/FMN-containing dehydrogenase